MTALTLRSLTAALAASQGIAPEAARKLVEAYAAAAEEAAYGLGIGLFGGKLGAENDLKGALIHAGHEVLVEGPATLGRVGCADVLIYALVAGDVYLPAAVEPEHGLDHALGVVFVSGLKAGGAVDEGAQHGDLSARALNGDAERLLCALEEGGVELVQGDISGVKLGDVFDVYINSKMLHDSSAS